MRVCASITATVILLCRALVVGDVAKNAAKTSSGREDATTRENRIALIIGKESLPIETIPSLGYRISPSTPSFGDWIGIVVPYAPSRQVERTCAAANPNLN